MRSSKRLAASCNPHCVRRAENLPSVWLRRTSVYGSLLLCSHRMPARGLCEAPVGLERTVVLARLAVTRRCLSHVRHSSLCQIIALSHTVDERDRRIAELTVTLSNLRAEILTARDAFKQENEKLVKQLSMKTQLIAEKSDRVIDLDDKLAKVQCAPPLQSRPLHLVPQMRAPRSTEGFNRRCAGRSWT